MLASQLSKQRLEHRMCFLHLLPNACFPSQQGLPFRGDGNELDSNYMQLICLHSENIPNLVDWIKQRTDKYTSSDNKNEMIQVMAK